MKEHSDTTMKIVELLRRRHIEQGMNKNRQRVTRSLRHLIHSEFGHVNWNTPENVTPPPRVVDWAMTCHRPAQSPAIMEKYNKIRRERRREGQERFRRQELELQEHFHRCKDDRRGKVTPEERAKLISRRKASTFDHVAYEKMTKKEKELDLQEHYRKWREKNIKTKPRDVEFFRNWKGDKLQDEYRRQYWTLPVNYTHYRK